MFVPCSSESSGLKELLKGRSWVEVTSDQSRDASLETPPTGKQCEKPFSRCFLMLTFGVLQALGGLDRVYYICYNKRNGRVIEIGKRCLLVDMPLLELVMRYPHSSPSVYLPDALLLSCIYVISSSSVSSVIYMLSALLFRLHLVDLRIRWAERPFQVPSDEEDPIGKGGEAPTRLESSNLSPLLCSTLLGS